MVSWANVESVARRLEGNFRSRDDRGGKAIFPQRCDRDPPAEPCKEVWIIAGRRAGKDSIASLLASNIAAMFNDSDGRLRPGERALISCLAVDREQARIVLNYCRAFFTDVPLLQHMVERETAYGFELNNRVDISVSTNSFRSVRGRPVLCGIFDEIAFWRDDNSANPDEEVYAALKPGLASLPGLARHRHFVAISASWTAAQEIPRPLRQGQQNPGHPGADAAVEPAYRSVDHRRSHA